MAAVVKANKPHLNLQIKCAETSAHFTKKTNNNNSPSMTTTKEHLYHYTTQEGLLGILENNSLWATHYKFLSDYSEMSLFKNKLIEFVEHDALKSLKKVYSEASKKIISADKEIAALNEDEKHDLAEDAAEFYYKEKTHVLINELYNHIEQFCEIYITSFCESHFSKDQDQHNNGLLKQWLVYGKEGGYAIEFNKNSLKKLIIEEKKRFNYKIFCNDVHYSGDEEYYKEYFANDLDNIKCFVKERMQQKTIGTTLTQPILDALIRCTMFYKDERFIEEKEFKIIALPEIKLFSFLRFDFLKNRSQYNKPRKFRERNGELIPYIELFDCHKKNDKTKKINPPLPIQKIIVGPHKDKEARAIWLKIQLASMGRSDIKVAVSQIPFVEY